MMQGKGSTLEMGLQNGSWLLERLGKDVPTAQFLRELVKNAMEANASEIDLDLDWVQYGLEGRLKLAVTDNGSGMSGQDMLEKINRFASSGHAMGEDKNFGFGGKTATFPQNPEGTIYLSRKNAMNSMVRFHRDENEVWGLKQFTRPDGTFGHFTSIEDAVMPRLIVESGTGTSVILLGQTPNQNTLLAPKGVRGGHYNWLIKELNSRFFHIPSHIRLRVHQFASFDGEVKGRRWVGIKGNGWFLENLSEARGTVSLDAGDIHWWVIPRSDQMQRQSGIYLTTGHLGLLHDGEMYDLQEGAKGTRKLRNFGIVFNNGRVVIYIKPKGNLRALPNSARTTLLVDGQPFPWDYFADGFRRNMPPEIQELERISSEKTSRAVDLSEIHRNLRSIYPKFLQVSRYIPNKNGKFKTTPTAEEYGGEKSVTGTTKKHKKSRSGGRDGGTQGSLYEIFQTQSGTDAKRVDAFQLPLVKWVRLADGTRSDPEDGLEDRAASYSTSTKVITANGDFRIYTDTEKKLLELHRDNGVASKIVPAIVRKWYTQQLIETVLVAEQFRDSERYSGSDFEALINEEALTCAMLAKFNLIHVMQNEIAKLTSVSAA